MGPRLATRPNDVRDLASGGPPFSLMPCSTRGRAATPQSPGRSIVLVSFGSYKYRQENLINCWRAMNFNIVMSLESEFLAKIPPNY